MQRILALAGVILVGLLLPACGGQAAPPTTPTPRTDRVLVPTPRPTLAPVPVPSSPTPHPAATPWVQARLDAAIALYNISPTGTALLRNLELRQMRVEPGFFGSYGFKGWGGGGQAQWGDA